MVNDPIADLIIRIKNGYLARNKEMVVPVSKFKAKILDLLVTEGFLDSYKVDKTKKEFKVILKYQQGEPVFTGVKRVSKPGMRIYIAKRKITQVLGGYGKTVLSTSKGVMTGQEARKKGLGGELLFEIW